MVPVPVVGLGGLTAPTEALSTGSQGEAVVQSASDLHGCHYYSCGVFPLGRRDESQEAVDFANIQMEWGLVRSRCFLLTPPPVPCQA